MVTHRMLRTNGINMHVAEAGEGPLVVLLHGFPEIWYSYRHQLEALAEAGYRAVAPDLRGYGRTDAPQEVSAYSMLRLAGDVVGLVLELGEKNCVVVGHDWGSPLASAVALFRPDLVRGVALLSVPYVPRGDVDVLTGLTERLGPNNYQVFFQEPGVAEKALEADVRASVVSTLIGASGHAPTVNTLRDIDTTAPFGRFADSHLPAWLSKEDVDYYTTEFERTGYRGGLNWYRNSLFNWELMAPWHGAPLPQTALFVAGDRDPVFRWPGMSDLVPLLRDFSMPKLTKAMVLEGCGHWTQQERPSEVSELLIEFLGQIFGTGSQK